MAEHVAGPLTAGDAVVVGVEEERDDVPPPRRDDVAPVSQLARESDAAARICVEHRPLKVGAGRRADGPQTLKGRAAALVLGPVVEGDREREGILVLMCGQAGLLARVVPHDKGVEHAQLRRVVDRKREARLHHRKEPRREGIVEPVADGGHRRDGHVGRRRLHVPVAGPAGLGRLRLHLVDHPRAVRRVEQRHARLEDGAALGEAAPAGAPQDVAVGLVGRQDLVGMRLEAVEGRVVSRVLRRSVRRCRARAAIRRRVAAERERCRREHLVAGQKRRARTKDALCLGVLVGPDQQASELEPQLRVLLRLLERVAPLLYGRVQSRVAHARQRRSCRPGRAKPTRSDGRRLGLELYLAAALPLRRLGGERRGSREQEEQEEQWQATGAGLGGCAPHMQ
mmetsp:Transcript_46600/g.151257  ORF Transcript_46600/g.151257 Transcript_46600/m.151257 type:complete len:397 (+) Transcript_46600:226-1416(+)